MDTIHLNYRTRKPRLQFDILACLVLNGKLSKGMTESRLNHGTHSEIIKAFKKLESEHLIETAGIKIGRGNRQWYYKITEEGLSRLIANDPHPVKFWKILFGYSHHDEKGLTPEKVDKYYDLFIERFLKYKHTDIFNMLDYFDDICDEWFHRILEGKRLGAEQKVIEVLANYPGISFKELVRRTGASEYEVKKCLMTYTLESHKYINEIKKFRIRPPLNVLMIKKFHNIYWYILSHSIVVVKPNRTNEKSYELSLFGVVLALATISYNDRHRLKHGLHYQNIGYPDYFDNIIHNYQHKLPLIFGKWRILKSILKLFSAYNFDVILDKELRRDFTQLSVIDRGSREMVESLRHMAFDNYNQIYRLITKGQIVETNYSCAQQDGNYNDMNAQGQQNNSRDYLLENDIDLRSQIDPNKIHSLKKKLNELILVLAPLSSQVEISSEDLDLDVIKRVSIRFEVQFAKEITALYYFHLYSDDAFRRAGDHRQNNPAYFDSFPDSSPKQCLFLLVKNDMDKPVLSEWFYGLIEDVNSLQKEIYNALPKRPLHQSSDIT